MLLYPLFRHRSLRHVAQCIYKTFLIIVLFNSSNIEEIPLKLRQEP